MDRGRCEAVEVDFQRFYRLPLAPGRLYTWRRFGVLLRGLPPDSLYVRLASSDTSTVAAADMSAWGLTDRLLAVIADAAVKANWQRGGGKGRPPSLFGEKVEGRRHRPPVMSPADARRVLANASGRVFHG